MSIALINLDQSGRRYFLNALERTRANGLVAAVVLILSIPLYPCQGAPPPSNLSSRPKRRDLRFPLLEKLSPEAIHPPHIRCPRK